MTKRVAAKHKIDRRLNENLWGRAKSPANRKETGPGQHGARRKGKLSDYGNQLRAKQKLKGYYANITERQFRKIYAEAERRRGDTGENMVGLLESRLDAIVYRAKFAPTTFAARQLVSHGHVKVNGKRLTVSSALLKPNDSIELSPKAKDMILVLGAIQSTERDVPDYVEVDHNKKTAKYTRVPKLSDIPYPVQMNPSLIVEFYSR
jgi:small subunit ribosomal protein S4